MKRCPYCGAEYPDDASECSIDRERLPENVPQTSAANEQIRGSAQSTGGERASLPDEQVGTADKNLPYLTFPDYRWSARDAWKCMGMILVFQFVLGMIIFTLDRQCHGFHRWHGSGFGHFFMDILHYGVGLLTAAYFARTESLAPLLEGIRSGPQT
jgi:hypothetical protein